VKHPPQAPALAAAIAEATGTPFEILALAPVAGGGIHRAWRLDGRDGNAAVTCFAKVSEASFEAMFAAEADGLAALRQAGALRVPRTITQGANDDESWLVLEWLVLVALGPRSAAALGTALAAQHRQPRERFGWARDNFIGSTPQANGWSDDWLDFWRGKRLHPQLRLAARNRLPSRMIDRGERLLADCEAFFRHHVPQPSLLHGDLWVGNAAALADGTPVLFDPAAYVGDREADVAMTELFGGFPREFPAAYREAWPLADGYAARRDFYNVYHVLNHANLFAGAYVRQSEEAIERLLAQIR
jgi:protein-ribulosamine 3-kinase